MAIKLVLKEDYYQKIVRNTANLYVYVYVFMFVCMQCIHTNINTYIHIYAYTQTLQIMYLAHIYLTFTLPHKLCIKQRRKHLRVARYLEVTGTFGLSKVQQRLRPILNDCMIFSS